MRSGRPVSRKPDASGEWAERSHDPRDADGRRGEGAVSCSDSQSVEQISRTRQEALASRGEDGQDGIQGRPSGRPRPARARLRVVHAGR